MVFCVIFAWKIATSIFFKMSLYVFYTTIQKFGLSTFFVMNIMFIQLGGKSDSKDI